MAFLQAPFAAQYTLAKTEYESALPTLQAMQVGVTQS
jgi:hypothetical protein